MDFFKLRNIIKTDDFFNALSDGSGLVTRGLEATNVSTSVEERLHSRIIRGQSARRRVSSLRDNTESAPDPINCDDSACDGFGPESARSASVPLDLSIKSSMKFTLRDTSKFKRIKSLDWSRACAGMAPETESQLLTNAATYHVWPTMLCDKGAVFTYVQCFYCSLHEICKKNTTSKSPHLFSVPISVE